MEQHKQTEEELENKAKPDPSIREQFPGASTSKKKVMAGKRNTGTLPSKGDKKVMPADDKPQQEGEDLIQSK